MLFCFNTSIFNFDKTHANITIYITCKTVKEEDDLYLQVQKAPAKKERKDIITSLSWAISWVFTWPDTRFTRPSTCPVSSPQMVQVVSMLEVPADTRASRH